MPVSDILLRGTHGERIMNKFGFADYQYPTGRPLNLVIIVPKQWCGRSGVRTPSWARDSFLLNIQTCSKSLLFYRYQGLSPPPRR